MSGMRAPSVDGPRVGYVLSRFPKLSETFILREMDALERRGWHIDVFPFMRVKDGARQPQADHWLARLGRPDTPAAVALANFCWLCEAPGSLLSLYLLVVRELWREPGECARGLVAVARAALWARRARTLGIAHVHAHFARHPVVAALAIARLARITFSFTAHSHDVYRRPAMLATKVRAARFVVAVSELLRDAYLAPLALPGRAGAIHVIRCGIDTARYGIRPVPAPAPVIRLLAVARLIEVKGLTYLIEACRILGARGQDVHCRIIGEGPLRGALEEQIATAGLPRHIELLGARTQQEVLNALRTASVFVLASVVQADGTMEGVPVSLMEAMAVGVPVVATRTGAIPELVEDGVTGLLVDSRDAAALADAIERLARDTTLAGQMVAAARTRMETAFDLEGNCAELERLFREAVGTRAAVTTHLERETRAVAAG